MLAISHKKCACSAPDYPQFQADDSDRYGNMAAVAKLRGPDWHTPEMIQFGAVHPRPPAVACYDYIDVPGASQRSKPQNQTSHTASFTQQKPLESYINSQPYGAAQVRHLSVYFCGFDAILSAGSCPSSKPYIQSL